MLSHDGRLVIVFNGEIYNHEELRNALAKCGVAFEGRSDTEVLLAAYREWGSECVKRLRGMFAFAIYDTVNRTLFAARDRAGEKPLYWAMHRGGFVFASELKALLRDDAFQPRLSPEGLAYYLAYGYVPGALCILQGVNKVKPGHFLTWFADARTVTEERYWDIPMPDPTSKRDRVALVDELDVLLTSAVREQLIADVPVAVLLSGGVDSSLVTAIASSVSSARVRTYTVSIPGFPEMDEGRYARRVANYFGTEHVELALDASSLNVLSMLARQYDEPIADSSAIPTYLLARAVSLHCKVVLGGDGGDELFGGYKAYQGSLKQDRIRRMLPGAARNLIAACAGRLIPIGSFGRNAVMGLRGDLADAIAQSGVMFDDRDRVWLSRWLARQPQAASPKVWKKTLVETSRGIPGAAMAADFRSYLPEDILVKIDRASMLCSLEMRAPFLDHRIAEFAYSKVPNELRVSQTERKILLKDLARRRLPRDLDIDRKQGFSIPLSTWITPETVRQWREDCGQQIRELFGDRNFAHLSRSGFHSLYALMMLTSWMRHYRVCV